MELYAQQTVHLQSAANISRAMLLCGAVLRNLYASVKLVGQRADQSWLEWYLMTGISMLINFVTEFLYWRLVVYRDSINTNDRAKNDWRKKNYRK
jgi:hypothetical protein